MDNKPKISIVQETHRGKEIIALRFPYNKEFKPNEWLFEGQKGKQYSATSILWIVKHSAQLAGIKKRVYPHSVE